MLLCSDARALVQTTFITPVSLDVFTWTAPPQATEEERSVHAAALEDLWYLTSAKRRPDPSDSVVERDAPPVTYKTSGAKFYKVRYTDAVDLMRSHSGYLVGGWLFIESEDLKAIIAGRFRTYISACLVQANKALPPLLRDERLAPILKDMSKAYAGPAYGQDGVKVRRRGT